MKKGLLLGLSMAAAGAAFAQEGVAPQTKTIENENTITMQQDSTSKEVVDTLNRFDATQFDGKSEIKKDKGNEKEPRIEVHGSARLGSNVTPLLKSVLGYKPAIRLTIDACDTKSGIGASIIRFDDFDKNMDNPAGQLTMVDLYWQKKFGKFSITGVGEYVNIDKIGGSDSFTPIVGLTYDAGRGWTIDAWACYTFQKGENVAAFRAGVTKKLNESTSLAVQAIYNGGKKSCCAQVDVNLGNGLGAQLGLIVDENGNVTPTLGGIYKF